MNRLLIEKIIEDYFGEEKNNLVEPLKGGLANFNYRISMSHGKHFFLKVFRGIDSERVTGITDLINNILEYHFPTAGLIFCPATNRFYWHNQQQYAIMTNYIDGKYPEKNIMNLYKIGTLLGMLHQIPVKVNLLQDNYFSLPEMIDKITKSNVNSIKELQEFLNIVSPFIQRIPGSGFRKSLIHGDVFLDNLLQTEFGDIFFIDFESGCIEKSIFDLSRAVIGCAILNDEIDLNLAIALLTGYDNARNLDSLEREFLFEYIIYAGTISSLWRFIEFNIKRPDENRTQLYKNLMKPTVKFTLMGKDKFTDSMKTRLIL